MTSKPPGYLASRKNCGTSGKSSSKLTKTGTVRENRDDVPTMVASLNEKSIQH
jgi:hypothetical protein